MYKDRKCCDIGFNTNCLNHNLKNKKTNKNRELVNFNNSINIRYVWFIFCLLNDILSEWKYYVSLKRKASNWINFLNKNKPHLMSHESSVTTLKFPHVSFLSLAKRRFNKFFKQLTSEKLIIILQEIIDKIYGQGKIVIVGIPELHKCHLKCHKASDNNHDIKNCHCRDEENKFIRHLCKRDWHIPILHLLEIDLSLWPHGYYIERISPFRSNYVEKLGFSLDEVTHKLCYLIKNWKDIYENPQLFQRHGLNPDSKRPWYIVYDSELTPIKQEKMRKYGKIYRRENPEKIKQCLSHSTEYEKLSKKIQRLDISISKSRSDKKKTLREKKRELVFELSKLKKSLLQQTN